MRRPYRGCGFRETARWRDLVVAPTTGGKEHRQSDQNKNYHAIAHVEETFQSEAIRGNSFFGPFGRVEGLCMDRRIIPGKITQHDFLDSVAIRNAQEREPSHCPSPPPRR